MSTIKQNRLKHNLTQKDLASALGCDRTIIAKWENRNVLPTNPEFMLRLYCIFNNEKHPLINLLQKSTELNIIDTDTQIKLAFEYFK